MNRLLTWLTLDTPLCGLGQGHSLTIDPPDPHAQGGGGYSATIEHDPDDEDDDFLEDDPGMPDTRTPEERASDELEQSRMPATRFKSHDEAEKGYQHLQSEKDRLATQYSALERQVQTFQSQAQQQDQSRDASAQDGLIKKKATQFVDSVRKQIENVNADDPKFGDRYLEAIAESLFRETLSEIPTVSRKQAQEIFREERNQENAGKMAERELQGLLEKSGMKDEGYLRQAYKELNHLNAVDPTWMKRVPEHEQLPFLVEQVKSSGVVFRGQSKQDRQAQQQQQQQQAFGGTLNEGANLSRRTGVPQGEDNQGSTLTDLANNKKQRRALATSMMRNAAR